MANCFSCGKELTTGDGRYECFYCSTLTPKSPLSGWICSKCKKSYSPFVTECKTCNDGSFKFNEP